MEKKPCSAVCANENSGGVTIGSTIPDTLIDTVRTSLAVMTSGFSFELCSSRCDEVELIIETDDLFHGVSKNWDRTATEAILALIPSTFGVIVDSMNSLVTLLKISMVFWSSMRMEMESSWIAKSKKCFSDDGAGLRSSVVGNVGSLVGV